MPEQHPVYLLWTGGWDSTFRLLELLFVREQRVQPWYLVDEDRASSDVELQTMRSLGAAIRARSAQAADLLLEPRLVAVSAVLPDATISDRYGQLGLGSQYDWLARFAAQHGIDDLELSIEKRESRVYRMLWPNVERVQGRGGTTYRLRSRPDNPDLELFRAFEFPILHLTKSDLRSHVRERGWSDIMGLTWFCHEPRVARPCGNCTPCLVALEEGLGDRIPLTRRVRPRLRLLKKKWMAARG